MSSVWIKICGIRSAETARQISRLPIDAIGLNFYRNSKRFITPEIARCIVEQLPGQVVPVGLFVNHSIEDILAIAWQVGLSTIQLHGDESPALLAELSSKHNFHIIRALRPDSSSGGFGQIDEYLKQVNQFGGTIERLLIDSAVTGAYGGTGHQADWHALAQWLQSTATSPPPVVLAGGLTAANVGQGIEATGCQGVDVASGVEDATGWTDFELTKQFVEQVKSNSST